jgi:hypothetical protein
MTVRVGINGFGRIGRSFFRAAKQRGADVDFVAVNDLGSLETMAHLLKYDSVLGQLPESVKVTKTGIKVGDDELRVLSERDPKKLPWSDLGVDVVVESTGFFATRDTAAYHLEGGAPLVIVSAPCTGADATFVYGVNHKTFDPKKHKVVSNASCTTNCFVPLVKVLDDAFGVEKGLMTTIDLSYPIGRFQKGTNITSERRQALIDGIARLPVDMRAAVNKLSDQQLDTPYRPGGWTVRQVLHHVPDSHLNAYIRFKLALTESEPTIKPYDEKQWAELVDVRLTPIEVSLSLLENLHARWTLLLRALEPAAFARTFRHPDIGLLTLDTQLGLYEWHGRHHVAHITSLRSRMGWS